MGGTEAPIVLVMDDGQGPQQAFPSAFAPDVKTGRADVAVVSFDKGIYIHTHANPNPTSASNC